MVLRVQVQPGAGRNAVVGIHGDALKVRVAAPPVSGKANEAVISLVCSELGISSSEIEISGGMTGRLKRLKIKGIESEDFQQRIEILLENLDSGLVRKRN